MQHSGPQFIHYVIPSAFLLRFEMCQNKNLEKNKKPWSLGGAVQAAVAFPRGISLICLGCLSCSVEIGLLSSFWVVMRIHSVILEIFLEV